MRKNTFLVLFLTFLITFGLTVSVNAALVDNGNGTITDTDRNLMWLQDANYAFTSGYDSDGRMNVFEAQSWAEGLVFASYGDWRLPYVAWTDNTCDEDPAFGAGYNCTGSEMGTLYYIEGMTGATPLPFINLQSDWYWAEYSEYEQYGHYFNFTDGYQAPRHPANSLYALAVRDIEVVPEPISSTLFVVGGIFLAGRRFFKRTRS